MRVVLGGPLVVDSWFRCPRHPIEAAKKVPGPHTTGYAADIRLSGQLLAPVHLPRVLAAVFGMQGIIPSANDACGIGIPVSRSFVHVDRLAGALRHLRRPAVWLYKEK